MKTTTSLALVLALFLCFFNTQIIAQDTSSDKLKASTFSGLKFRSLGPAFMSGRIADIAIHPENEHLWYVAAGSGGVWKTTNSGTSWKAIFDHQKSYSIGCISIDPTNPHVVWVGTGENVGGRHVGFGDGIYKSEDGGAHWQHMGLKKTQHISKVVIHPENSDVIWVAAQGPLWNKGDERGLYKSTDGGKTWKKTLGDAEWIGVTDILIDPRNPDRLYAATWQRHRNVAAYMGGGPGTAIYRSEDGGEQWIKLKSGLPKSNMGKIGLAISPQQPDVIYAAIELDRRSGAVYRSSNRGASWNKMSEAVAGATGPHYYQELYASPHAFDRLYLVDVRIQVSNDGGKNFKRLKEEKKHSDNHAIAFRKDEPDYLLVGCDGGVYESFDLAQNWRFVSNLPLTQYYKLAVDDAKPFYTIYGGTQDNGTHAGPIRTDNNQGITNEDWSLILYADGHQPATEPGNPDIVYAEWQEGNLVRIDRTTGEIISIKPQPGPGEDFERFNWDAPILVSPHKNSRIYFASQRVWRSDDRGDSWTAISGDLTRDQERISLPIMGKTQSWDNAWDLNAMSNYNTITSLAESPQLEGLIYVGTDDGFIQVTEDGGNSWHTIAVDELPGVPATAFVNDIKADLYDANVVYVALDNHKFGDLRPYLYKSNDRGRSWKSISSNLPEPNLVWRFVQDHEVASLCFLATEFGIYFTLDGGEKWIQFKGKLPTMSFRDITIQRRENDLVAASFGRSFYVLDDYSPLRKITTEKLEEEALLFDVKDAWWYFPKMGKHGQGASFYVADNPPFGAVFTYYLSEGYTTLKSERKKKEKKLVKSDESIEFPGWDALEEERIEKKPRIWLTVKDAEGAVVRRLPGSAKKGFHRVDWNLRNPHTATLDASRDISKNAMKWSATGSCAPGTYSVSLSKEIDGVISNLSEEVFFEVIPLRKPALEGVSPEKVYEYWASIAAFETQLSEQEILIRKAFKLLDAMELALARATGEGENLSADINTLKKELYAVKRKMRGDAAKNEIGEKNTPGIYSYFRAARNGTSNTYGPTKTQQQNLELAKTELEKLRVDIDVIVHQKLAALEERLRKAGASPIK